MFSSSLLDSDFTDALEFKSNKQEPIDISPSLLGDYAFCNEKGLYQCICCGKPIFESSMKVIEKTGWPTFNLALEGAVQCEEKYDFFFPYQEVSCYSCHSKLGFLFKEQDGQVRYCMNSVALKFVSQFI